jgi:hypothetical protein
MSISSPLRVLAAADLGDAERLLRFNRQLIDQALVLVAAHEAPDAPAFATHVGPHLRHVIEHYEALVRCQGDAVVDYDRRPRDRELERTPALARARLEALLRQLAGWPDAMLQNAIRVQGKGGPAGEFDFVTSSSIGRELVFLASHTTHHFALLQMHCLQHGIATDPNLGQASATVAYAIGAASAIAATEPKETPCATLQPSD